MTEKQFQCTNISSNGMTGLFWLGKDQISVYDVLKILNDLLEENEQLKKENATLKGRVLNAIRESEEVKCDCRECVCAKFVMGELIE